jgi:predicted nucleotidyltransferase
MKQYTIERIEKEGMIVFSAIMGSHAYGTNLPTSDTDIRGIFIQPLEDILGFGKIDQVSDEKNDIIYYEIGRFLDLLKSNNPNILELLCVPLDCIKIMNPIMKLIFDHTDEFLTKKCRWSFGGYAVEQIKKARGLNKKMNWEENEMVRKTVLDFCYILVDGGSQSFKEWIRFPNFGLTQKDYGLAAIDHGHDLYAMYLAPAEFAEKWGIVSNEETANDVQLTSIPKHLNVKGYLYFNKDGYSSHCKKYKEYLEWKTNRNETRVNMAKAHGKKFDGKNLNHCLRLLNVANEIAEGKGLNVRRSPEEIKKLIAIRKGEYEYEDILAEAEGLIAKMDKTFEESSLPNSVDVDMVNDILIEIRKTWYGREIIKRAIDKI